MDRPYVIVCTGMSLDGKISTYQRKQSNIATNDDKTMLYDCRVKVDAVMVGGNTLLLDDPSLTVKTEERQKEREKLGRTKEPFKVAVISDVANMNLEGDFLKKGETRRIVFTTEKSSILDIEKLKEMCEIYICGKSKVDVNMAFKILYSIGVSTLMVEGGGELIFSLVKENLVDEIQLKIGDIILGGRNAPTLCDGDGFTEEMAKKVKLINIKQQNNCLILRYIVDASN